MSQMYDVLIRGAFVYDGQGNAPFQADVAVQGDRIARIGSLDGAGAASEVDGEGLALSPGFIDVHTHDDFAALAHPDMSFKSRGGVTTCIVGNCGFGAAPFTEAVDLLGRLTPDLAIDPYVGHAGYAAALEANPPGVNIGVLAGHGTIRMAVLGSKDRPPTDREMAAMKSTLDEALGAGVLGLSSGLIYDPGRYARTEELAELAGVMRGTGALYVTHMRDEGTGLVESVAEAIDIGDRAGVGVQISHHKASGRESWGMVESSLALIDAAQARGKDVHADQYPYTAGSTSLQAILENGAFAESGAKGGFATLSGDDVLIASSPGHPQWEGRTVADLGVGRDQPARAVAEEIARAARGTTVVLHMMSEDDVQRVMRHPSTMIGSDGIPTLDGKPHPRLYNTFARVLGHYARDLELFDLSTAIYRMCGLSARKFGLVNRGVIREGAYADLVAFDPSAVIDNGTFEAPNQYPSGIVHVLVNGRYVVSAGSVSGERPGQVLGRAT